MTASSRSEFTAAEKWQALWSDEDAPPFIIAELSGNHGQDLAQASALVQAAAECGADAIKLQTYTADTMTVDSNLPPFRIDDPESLWAGENLHALYARASTPWPWHAELFAQARALGLLAFSSPFDATAVDFLETLEVPAYKIASFEITDLPLLRRVAKTGRPVIVSTGLADLLEIETAMKWLRQHGAGPVALLQCTSRYPATAAAARLGNLRYLAEHFRVPVGFSDHTLGAHCPIAAAALGARIIEKHFVLEGAENAIDAGFSATPKVMRDLVQGCLAAWQAASGAGFDPHPEDQAEKKYRRSLLLTRDVKAGERLSPDNLRVLRPAHGLPPCFYEQVLGKKLRIDLPAGTGLNWSHLQE